MILGDLFKEVVEKMDSTDSDRDSRQVEVVERQRSLLLM